MTVSKYTKFGLRADRNLSDLPDANTALGNVLDDFDINAEFVPADLNVIDGLRTTNLYVEDFTELENGLQQYQPIVQNADGINVVGIKEPVNPLVTVRDNLLNKKSVLGDPPYGVGGKGPTAKVVSSTILRDGVLGDGDDNIDADHLKVLTVTAIDSGATITVDQASYNVRIGDLITITGTITNGAIPGYTTGKQYLVSAINSLAGQVIEFDIKDADTGTAITSATAGTLAGATFTVIRNAANISHDLSATPDDIFDTADETVITNDEYWVNGIFAFSNRLHQTFKDEFGALHFDGYIGNPNRLDMWIQTNGFLLFEKFDEDGQRVIVKQVSQEEFDVTMIGGVSTNYISVSESDMTHLMRGMTFTDDNGTEIEITNLSSTSSSNNYVTCSPNPVLASNSVITISYDYGNTNVITERYKPDDLLRGENQRHRLTLWWPNVTKFSPQKTRGFYSSSYAKIDISDGSSSLYDGMAYFYWYKEKQGAPKSIPKQYTFEKFKRDRISYTNTQTEEYVSNENPVFIRYTPPAPTELSSISRNSFSSSQFYVEGSVQWNGQYKFTIPSLGIQVGDYMYITPGTGSYTNHYLLQVVEIKNSIATMNPHQATDIDTIMTYYGLSEGDSVNSYWIRGDAGIAGIYSSVSGISLTGASEVATHSIKPVLNHADYGFTTADPVVGDYVAELSASGHDQMRRISGLSINLSNPGADGSFTSKHVGGPATYSLGGAPSPVVVIAHRGLVDRSIAEVCTDVYGLEVTANTAGGVATSDEITVTDTSAILVGDYIQFEGLGGANDSVIPTGTTVASVDSATQITISNAIPSGKTLNAASTVVLIRANAGPNTDAWGNNGGYSNKEACVLPLNTAPPFVGTNLGLATTSTHPHIVVGGEFGVTGLKIAPPPETGDSTTVDEVAAGDVKATKGMLVKNKPNNIDPLNSYWVLMEDA